MNCSRFWEHVGVRGRGDDTREVPQVPAGSTGVAFDPEPPRPASDDHSLRVPPAAPARFTVPDVAFVAIAVVSGVSVAGLLEVTPAVVIAGLWLLTAAMFVPGFLRSRGRRRSGLFVGCFLLAACRWALVDVQWTAEHQAWSGLTASPAVRVRGRVSSIPTTRAAMSRGAGTTGSDNELRTALLLETEAIETSEGWRTAGGTVRVLVNGDASRVVTWGDQIEVLGQPDQASQPTNPGEFDFADYSRRQGVSGVVFVRHPLALRVVDPASWWFPGPWLCDARSRASDILRLHLSDANRGIAEALLLGNRGFLSDRTELEFITSGTMHLLAISGLHVGILYLFLDRLLVLLKVRHQNASLAAFAFCLAYAFLTDLRPSVLRAVVFIGLHVLGQRLRRPGSMVSQIAVTSLLLTAMDPNMVFQSGAWLSFLAVAGLSCAGMTRQTSERDVPEDALTWFDRLWQAADEVRGRLALRYRQMLAVSLVTAPLVASQFHIISAIGLILNVILIPVTAGILILGFVSLGWGVLLPSGPQPVAWAFNAGLTGLQSVIAFASDRDLGSTCVPDTPPVFLFSLYGLLAVAFLSRTRRLQISAWCALAVAIPGLLFLAARPPAVPIPRCTVLDVGHGNAVIVETARNEVFLFDAGAMNRSDGTSDIVCGCLWERGHRMINAIVVSHPDADHYNGVEGILNRMTVGRLIISLQTATDSSQGTRQMIQAARRHNVPISIALDGDSISTPGFSVDFRQVLPGSDQPPADNDASLVSIVRLNAGILGLPGDLESAGQERLRSRLTEVDVLVSPHHGSLDANTQATFEVFRPDDLIVSSRDPVRPELLALAAPETTVWSTEEFGAMTLEFTDSGIRIRPFVAGIAEPAAGRE